MNKSMKRRSERGQKIRVGEYGTGRGKSIRRLNGTNLGPPIRRQSIPSFDLARDIESLDIPMIRLHDAPLENGIGLVDIHHIFPLFHLDAEDPANYCFAATDDYLRNCLKTGARILFRLGESIEHSLNHYQTRPPADFGKWAVICINIIRHCNEGWAGGFRFGIRYWEIWCEPDIGPKLWAGSWDDYIRLYTTAAKQIKQRFPDLMIGGPVMGELREEEARRFLETCRDRQAPLDFFSWHCYTDSLPKLLGQPDRARALVDGCGFPEAELFLDEWHYLPGGFFDTRNWNSGQERRDLIRGQLVPAMQGIESAAFAGAVLTGLQDTPVTAAFYYNGTALGFFGLFCPISYVPNKVFHLFRVFSRLAASSRRLAADRAGGDADSIRVLAGCWEDGRAGVLLSAFGLEEACTTEIDLEFCRPGTRWRKALSILDADRDFEIAAVTSDDESLYRTWFPAGNSVQYLEIMPEPGDGGQR